jgi:hypothetical protein
MHPGISHHLGGISSSEIQMLGKGLKTLILSQNDLSGRIPTTFWWNETFPCLQHLGGFYACLMHPKAPHVCDTFLKICLPMRSSKAKYPRVFSDWDMITMTALYLLTFIPRHSISEARRSRTAFGSQIPITLAKL